MPSDQGRGIVLGLGELTDLDAHAVELRLTGYFEPSEDFVPNCRPLAQNPQSFTSQNPFLANFRFADHSLGTGN